MTEKTIEDMAHDYLVASLQAGKVIQREDIENYCKMAAQLLPIVGGDTVYMQQQNFSLEALSKRDQREDPFNTSSTTKTDQKPPDLPENSG